MYTKSQTETKERSVLATLRSLIPSRRLSFSEGLRIAELQANRLLELFAIDDGPVPNEVITELPRIRIAYRYLPTSGLSYWDGQCWVIALNASEPETRQRFTLSHEYKHIIDHGRIEMLYPGSHRHTPAEEAERAADYFAGCLLMPKRLFKSAWGNGIQRPTALAAQFDVSHRAAEVRLDQLGLSESTPRCSTRFLRTATTSYATRSAA